MKKRFLVGLAAAIAIMMCLMMGGCGASDDAEAFDITTAEDSPEWVAQLDQAKDAEQLFVVAAVGNHCKDEGAFGVVIKVGAYIAAHALVAIEHSVLQKVIDPVDAQTIRRIDGNSSFSLL